jgi:hypothetical protein
MGRTPIVECLPEPWTAVVLNLAIEQQPEIVSAIAMSAAKSVLFMVGSPS